MHGFQESPRAIIIFRVIPFLLLIKESWHKIEKYLTDDERTIACRGTFRLQIVQTGNRSGALGIEMRERLGLKAGSKAVGTEKFPSVLVKWSKMTQGTCSYEPKRHVTVAAVSKRTQQSESEASLFHICVPLPMVPRLCLIHRSESRTKCRLSISFLLVVLRRPQHWPGLRVPATH